VTLYRIERARRDLGTLALFVDLDEPELGSQLQDVRRRQHFLAEVGRGLDESLENDARLHGWRVQSLFKTVVVELGAARLVKDEDEGECYSEDPSGIKIPDYRIMLGDEELTLVEVKNVTPGRMETKVGSGELAALEAYAALNRTRLLFAHYWSIGNIWTLVDSSVLAIEPSAASLDLTTALKANEMGSLGDATIATTPPLVLRLRADTDAPRALGEAVDGGRRASFRIGEVEYLAAGRQVSDEDEQRITETLMQLGGWGVEETADVTKGDEVVSVDFTHRPVEEESGNPMQIVGALSSLYSAAFNQATLHEDGGVSRLAVDPDPGRMGDLIPADYWDRSDRTLSLWRLELQPSIGPRAK
jgi:hypothetical protein